ncbi:protein of unknown function [Ruminococcaceae bacterium BL-6]|nr:protein of unknown function [Ruminococcaceae bacterium BL-6]
MTCIEVNPPSKISDGVSNYERKNNREKAGTDGESYWRHRAEARISRFRWDA